MLKCLLWHNANILINCVDIMSVVVIDQKVHEIRPDHLTRWFHMLANDRIFDFVVITDLIVNWVLLLS